MIPPHTCRILPIETMSIHILILFWIFHHCWVMETTSLDNVALNKSTAQGPGTWHDGSVNDSTQFDSKYAVDGNEITDAFSCTHTTFGNPTWWMVDLQVAYLIYRVDILNRDSFEYRLQNFTVDVFLDDPRHDPVFPNTLGNICAYHKNSVGKSQWAEVTCDPRPILGRFVRVIKRGFEHLTVCEVKVFVPYTIFGKQFKATPNTKSLTVPQQFLGVFSSPVHCAFVMLQYKELSVYQFNRVNGQCMGATAKSLENRTSDENWSLYVEF